MQPFKLNLLKHNMQASQDDTIPKINSVTNLLKLLAKVVKSSQELCCRITQSPSGELHLMVKEYIKLVATCMHIRLGDK